MSTCAVKYEIWVWAGVSLSEPFIHLFYGVLCHVTLRCFTIFSSCQPVQLNMKFRVGLRYPSLTGYEIRVRNLDMLTCAVKYELLVWAVVSLSDPFILLFYGVLCYDTLRFIMVSYCYTLRCFTVFSLMSTCAVKYEILEWAEVPLSDRF